MVEGKAVVVATVLAVLESGTVVEVTDVDSLVVLGTDVVVAAVEVRVEDCAVVESATVEGIVVEVAAVEPASVVVSTIIHHNIRGNHLET